MYRLHLALKTGVLAESVGEDVAVVIGLEKNTALHATLQHGLDVSNHLTIRHETIDGRQPEHVRRTLTIQLTTHTHTHDNIALTHILTRTHTHQRTHDLVVSVSDK